MKTLVILGAGCSFGLAGIPTDATFIESCQEDIEKTHYLKEAFHKLYIRDEIYNEDFWIKERLEVCWNEIDENFVKPKIILKSEDIDKWFNKLIKLAREEKSEYKYFHQFFYREAPFKSPYQYLFDFALWELQKIVIAKCNPEFSKEISHKYKKLIDKIKSIAESNLQYISFNYDILLEKALDKFYYRGIDRPVNNDAVAVLKPHGSINWLERSDVCEKIINKVDAISINEVGYKNNILHKHSIVGLVGDKGAAGLRKAFGPAHYYELALQEVTRLIRESRKLIIIGYSLPITDSSVIRAILDSKPRGLKEVILVTKPNRPDEIDVLTNKIYAMLGLDKSTKITIFDKGVENWINL